MIDPANLRYLSSYVSLIREAMDCEKRSAEALKDGKVAEWSYLRINAQAAMDESQRRLMVQHGMDHGQVQKKWMNDLGELTPLL